MAVWHDPCISQPPKLYR